MWRVVGEDAGLAQTSHSQHDTMPCIYIANAPAPYLERVVEEDGDGVVVKVGPPAVVVALKPDGQGGSGSETVSHGTSWRTIQPAMRV